MRARSVLVGVLGVAVMACAACDSGPSRETSLSDAVAEETPEKLADEVADQGLPLARTELICVFEALLKEPDLTVGDIEDYSKNPDPTSPVAAAYQRVVPGCLDPTLSVPDQSPTPAVRRQLERALTGAGMTDEQASCYLDYLFDHDVTLREFVLATYGVTPSQEDAAVISQAAASCMA